MALTENDIRAIKGVMGEEVAPIYKHITDTIHECGQHRAEVVALQIDNAMKVQSDAARQRTEDLERRLTAEIKKSKKPSKLLSLFAAGVGGGIVALIEWFKK